eukprot:8334218-Heterocapsa_arctica.AAC.1
MKGKSSRYKQKPNVTTLREPVEEIMQIPPSVLLRLNIGLSSSEFVQNDKSVALNSMVIARMSGFKHAK